MGVLCITDMEFNFDALPSGMLGYSNLGAK